MDTLEVCSSYKVNGEETHQVPFQMMRSKVEPVYKKLAGWKTDITSIKNFNNLPPEMSIYINYINKTLGIPVKFISNGPGSDQIIVAL
jgi:adenylosuccinate synthase